MVRGFDQCVFLGTQTGRGSFTSNQEPGFATTQALCELIVAAREQFASQDSEPLELLSQEIIQHELIPREHWERTADDIRGSLGFEPDEPLDPFNLPIPGVLIALCA